MNEIKGILEIFAALQKYTVQYLVIGGAAVGFHGYTRMSTQMDGTISEKQDLDFWYNPTYTNYFNLLFALKDLGKDVVDFLDEQTPNPQKSFFRFESETFTLDFLPIVSGLNSFRLCYEKKKVSVIEDIEISIISKEDLIISKLQTARKKDFDDINMLQNLNEKE
jgi:predicted nucleotidyltransferase